MISENVKIWIWLTQAIGYNTVKMKKLFKIYPDIAKFYHGGINEWRLSGVFNSDDLERLSKEGTENTERIIGRCAELGYKILSID
ncbi:MAG: hypothetical protein IIZ36_00150, partial [Ruminococcus sp.]|nr:hypothetical protein [Ruminococcus sp.]